MQTLLEASDQLFTWWNFIFSSLSWWNFYFLFLLLFVFVKFDFFCQKFKDATLFIFPLFFPSCLRILKLSLHPFPFLRSSKTCLETAFSHETPNETATLKTSENKQTLHQKTGKCCISKY